jgi:uncharacterized integral membrane protein (TIGR00698 family)
MHTEKGTGKGTGGSPAAGRTTWPTTWRTTDGWGLVAVGAGVAASYAVSSLVPALGALTVAVVLGALARNAGWLGPRTLPGATRATKRLLRAGVVLLGLQLALPEVLALGWAKLLAIVAVVMVTFGGTVWAGRRLGVRQGTALLVAAGFSICGASAVAAMSAVTDGEDEDVATAIALVTLFGGLAMFALPPLGALLHLSEEAYGFWAGASVHEVAQVVAAGAAAGPTALAVAVVVKLTRVVLLGPLVVAASLARRRGRPTTSQPLMPLFVVGFLAMVAVRSLGIVPSGVLEGARLLTSLLLAGALFGLGAGVHLPSLLRTGGRAAALGAASTLLAAATAYLGMTLAG